ncbi:uncharacterized protein [Lolium perenne]|uniref:uncharacterized protein n=1 Tax=Lolium perenne TaxID=4522 RepID=UPI003A9A3D0D
MDFIEGLPKSDGYDVILFVVDRLTKYSHFMPLRHPFTAQSVANVFMDSIIKLHGVPLSIVSDHDKVRIKAYADKNCTEREFQEGDLLKLQPYAQTSVINRPCAKLAFKYFGPFKIVERIGMVAYKLALPQDCVVHPVFHVSQLKPFTQNYTLVYDKLPPPPDLSAVAAVSKTILVQWNYLPEDYSTWEDYHVLRHHFPMLSFGQDNSLKEGKMSRLCLWLSRT